ncbi:hypothetical protein EYC84_001746 [Monilinia fructicola]|uniref:Uncharacterized protein n=1 Tax=Monilinia fructicola TaxID=38448 RepID=A0A5M9JV61_MONFR|nr:hypothetical protein EYC84_001746 [Monilinia fructicola]
MFKFRRIFGQKNILGWEGKFLYVDGSVYGFCHTMRYEMNEQKLNRATRVMTVMIGFILDTLFLVFYSYHSVSRVSVHQIIFFMDIFFYWFEEG